MSVIGRLFAFFGAGCLIGRKLLKKYSGIVAVVTDDDVVHFSVVRHPALLGE